MLEGSNQFKIFFAWQVGSQLYNTEVPVFFLNKEPYGPYPYGKELIRKAPTAQEFRERDVDRPASPTASNTHHRLRSRSPPRLDRRPSRSPSRTQCNYGDYYRPAHRRSQQHDASQYRPPSRTRTQHGDSHPLAAFYGIDPDLVAAPKAIFVGYAKRWIVSSVRDAMSASQGAEPRPRGWQHRDLLKVRRRGL